MIDLSDIKTINDLTAKAVIERLKIQLSIVRSGSDNAINTWGKLSDSLNPEGGEGYFSEVRIEGNDYGAYLNKGIPDVPFSRGSGFGSPSAYINALQFWAIKKFGVSAVRARQLAFAIANTQKSSLGGSSSFSQAPANPGWVDNIEQELSKIIDEEYTKNTYFVVERETNRILNVRI